MRREICARPRGVPSRCWLTADWVFVGLGAAAGAGLLPPGPRGLPRLLVGHRGGLLGVQSGIGLCQPGQPLGPPRSPGGSSPWSGPCSASPGGVGRGVLIQRLRGQPVEQSADGGDRGGRVDELHRRGVDEDRGERIVALGRTAPPNAARWQPKEPGGRGVIGPPLPANTRDAMSRTQDRSTAHGERTPLCGHRAAPRPQRRIERRRALPDGPMARYEP